mmetsp:Transcript_27812/g.58767  ORF Transcript_27812/g.58767 Transcript_27812/m.58767 type:complete len:225 (-) Transcript_27812:474-1148(-)
MCLAPSRESRAHVIDFNLELFEGHGGLALLGRVIGEVLADDVAFFAEGFGEGFDEVDFGAGDEFFAFVVSSLIHTSQYRDSVQNAITVLHNLNQRSGNDGRSLLSVSVHLRSKVAGLTQSTGVAGPIWSTIPHQLRTHTINLLLKRILLPLTHRHKYRLQILRIMQAQPPHRLLIQHIVQIHAGQIPALLSLRVLKRHLLFAVAVRELFELLVDGGDAPGDEGD